ncbi:uncharacterized protein [Chironomus tepperi]|uniref:uncharacterized protein n=1 Tax=Chironomus tepperi TaxID=113505 RepID=UPI00391F8C03
MKIPRVDSCCCFGLETGGKILGWLGIIFGSLGSIFILIGIGIIVAVSCDELESNDEFEKFKEEYDIPECKILKFSAVIVLIVILIFCLIATFIDILLIQGIRTRNPGKLIPAVVIQAIGTVSTVIQELLTFSISGVIRALVVGGFMFYLFLVLYSLYVKIRNEQRASRNMKLSTMNC